MSLSHRVSRAEWIVEQRNDPIDAPVLKHVQHGYLVHRADIQHAHIKLLLQEVRKLVVKDGLLFRKRIINQTDQFALVLPEKYHEQVITGLHDDIGHPGFERTLDLTQSRYYWPKMSCDIQESPQLWSVCTPEKVARSCSIG